RIESLQAPLRRDRPAVPLEQARVIVAGGRGLGSRKNFDRLYELASLLGGETGATRVPVFNRWCGEERMIGQTGRTVRPRLYLGFGVSGQIQHTASIVESEIIVSINTDPESPLAEMSDYVVTDDAAALLEALIARLKAEKQS
ncbi:MAG TPA: electron transfer flavoprotein subunit alpha/FixB family protein, partial [Spirochaetota bacterium]|nr:electron transfer flavoprotein subunit alpha/FixB family protein [Spirochaetota bacterium]